MAVKTERERVRETETETERGPIVWNSLPEYLRDRTLFIDTFSRYLKTYFFARY